MSDIFKGWCDSDLNSVKELGFTEHLRASDMQRLIQCLSRNTALEYLDLYDQPNLTNLEQLVASILSHPTLRSANFFGCELGDELAFSLASFLYNLQKPNSCSGAEGQTKIEALNLGKNALTANGIYALSAALEHNSTLNRLNLYHNPINSDGIKKLCHALAAHPSLQTLNLSGNPLSSGSVLSVAGLLESPFCQITSICLSRTELGDHGTLSILNSIRSIKKVTNLNLSYNGISGTCLALNSYLLTDLKLRILSLEGNLLGIDGARCLNSLLKDKQSVLEHLDISSCSLGPAGCSVIASALENNTSLKHINLSDNQIGDSGIAFLSSSLPWNCHLSHIDLSKNNIEDAGAKTLSIALTFNSTLSSLILFKNCISEAGLAFFVRAIDELNTSLVHLDIRKNIEDLSPECARQLSRRLEHNKDHLYARITFEENYPIVRQSSTYIKSADSIHFLNCPSNPYEFSELLKDYTLVNTGCLPGAFFNVTRLSLVNVNLRSVPDFIFQLSQLTYLDMRRNQLRTLPAAISALTHLKVLHLSHNLIECIPCSLTDLSLDIFSIHANPLILISPDCIDLRELFFKFPRETRLFRYLKSLAISEDEKKTRLWRTRLMIIGDVNVGKTSLLQNLPDKEIKENAQYLKNSADPMIATDGVQIATIRMKNTASGYFCEEPVGGQKDASGSVIVWDCYDFAGQRIYYTTHSFFLAPNTIYLVVFNVKKCEEKYLSRVEYWIKSIQTRCGSSTTYIFLVGTHADDVTAKDLPPSVRILNHRYLKTRDAMGMFLVNNKKKGDLVWKNLKKTLCETAIKFKLVGQLYSNSMIKLQKALSLISPTVPFITYQSFQFLCASMQIPDLQVPEQLEQLTQLGFVLHFQHTGQNRLSEYIFIRPQFLCDMFANLITTRHNIIRNGLVNRREASFSWHKKGLSIDEDQLWALFEAFEIVIPVRPEYASELTAGKTEQFTASAKEDGAGPSQIYIVPSMLPKATPNLLDTSFFEIDENLEPPMNRFERIYQFKFLPFKFFSMLMVHCYNNRSLKVLSPWRCGFFLVLDQEKAKLVFFPDTFRLEITALGIIPCPLLIYITKTIDNLISTWYKCADVNLMIVCPSETGTFKHYISKEKIVMALRKGIKTLVRGNQTLNLELLAPEICMYSHRRLEVDAADVQPLSCLLGQGGFGCVYLASYKGETVAVKSYDNNFSTQHKTEDYESIDAYQQAQFNAIIQANLEHHHELEIMCLLDHPCIVKIKGFSFSPPIILMEYAQYGSLETYLFPASSDQKPFPWPFRLRIALDLSRALEYMHSQVPPICHLDISPNNLMVFSVDFQNICTPVIKLIDFSLATFLMPGTTARRNNEKGQYLAPEVLSGQGQTCKSDVYSFSIVLWQLWSRNSLTGMTEVQIKRGERPSFDTCHTEGCISPSSSASFVSLIQACWVHDPSCRPEFSFIKNELLKICKEEGINTSI